MLLSIAVARLLLLNVRDLRRIILHLIMDTFLNFTQTFIKRIFAVARDILVYFGFVDICRFEALNLVLAALLIVVLLFVGLVLAPPVGVHCSVD